MCGVLGEKGRPCRYAVEGASQLRKGTARRSPCRAYVRVKPGLVAGIRSLTPFADPRGEGALRLQASRNALASRGCSWH